MSDPLTQEILNFDPLQFAENMTGKSYKQDEQTSSLGLAVHLLAGDIKREHLESLDDTHFRTPFEDALRIFHSEGFDIVLDEPIKTEKRDDRYVVMWHPDGILLIVDSYGEYVNSCDFHYCFRFHPKQDNFHRNWSVLSSHCSEYDSDGELTICGYHDGREGFRHQLQTLREHGDFRIPWCGGLLYLVHHDEWGNHQSDEWKNHHNARMSRLPSNIRDLIGPAARLR